MLPIQSKANLMLFTFFTGCQNCHPITPRLQSATKSSWWTLVWSQYSLWMSGHPLMNSLVWVPSTLGGYWRDFLPSWSCPKCGARVGLTLPLTLAKWWGVRRSYQWLSLSQMEWVRGSLGWWPSFATLDQARVEPLVALPTLIQWDSHEPAMVVVKIFTNSPYFPWESFGLSFLDYPFSTFTVMPAQAASIFPQVILPKEKEGYELTVTLIRKEMLWESSLEEHHLSSLVLLLLPPLAPAASFSTYEERGLQTDERQLQHSSEAAATGHSGEVPTWVGAAPWTAWTEHEGRWVDCQRDQQDSSCCHQSEGTVDWQTVGPASEGARAIHHHIQWGPLSSESSGLSEAAHLALFYCWQSCCGSHTLHGWSAHCCLTTKDGGLCWIWELSCPSVYSFTGINKQPTMSHSHSASSGSPHVWHPGLCHSIGILIPHTHYLHPM